MSTRPITPLEGAIAPGNSPGWEIIVAPRRVGARAGTHEERPRVAGKFLFVGGEKLYVRGVTYGAFRPDEMGNEYHDLRQIESDFAQMASVGINTVRIPHTTPPRALLDAALRHGLRVMVGLSAEQYVGFLIDRKGAPDIAALIRARVRGCAGHPALLCYALGNEIPASLVRWLGPRRIARYLERLYRIVKEEDPDGLVTYVNYPTTEYLELPFLDLLCFNVYLESHDQLDAYQARLQNLVGDRPLILSEIGLDSLRNGEEAQARALDGQIRTAFAGGCAGVFVFTWTDEWHRGGAEVDDWAFGLTRRDRRPKPALAAVREAFAEVPFPPGLPWPRISVVVCTYNGGRTIRECLEGLRRIEYPDYEVIVVDDGSTDGTATIVGEYPVRLIRAQHRGLSNARNTGLAAATGDIVAYIDDDAYPDPHWLTYLAAAFLRTPHAGVGGPNIPPPGDGRIAECVANAPGNPVHVLLSDREAEHIPGCNMAFRKTCLEAIGGFDPQFRTAGDDVDVCWRLQRLGWTLGYHPAAMVWHHCRNSVRAYWRQQVGYGRAEALLERKWPEKYNGTGHVTWAGRIYGRGLQESLGWRRGRIYHGIWGTAPFQRMYERLPDTLGSLPVMPEWYVSLPALGLLAGLGPLWIPPRLVLAVLVLATSVSVTQAALSAAHATFSSTPPTRIARCKRRALTAALNLIQPLARLFGRLGNGFHPRRGDGIRWSSPHARSWAIWREHGVAPERILQSADAVLRSLGGPVRRGGNFDRWDLEIRAGLLGAARLLMACEDHGAGRQLVRFRTWPRLSLTALGVVVIGAGLSLGALFDGAWTAGVVLGVASLLVALRGAFECGAAIGAVAHAVDRAGGRRS